MYYSQDEVYDLIRKASDNICKICLIHSTQCSHSECFNCVDKCPCRVCSHNPNADYDSLSFGDKFTLIPKEDKPKTREDYLKAALDATVSRGNNESTLPLIAKLWSPLLGVDVTPAQVASAMIALKLARIARGHESEDSFVDIAGYAAIGGEEFSKGE